VTTGQLGNYWIKQVNASITVSPQREEQALGKRKDP
jgi:hypothetical protein